MAFQDDPTAIHWKLHLRASAERVFDMLATDAGRARFWAERTIEHDGVIDWHFPGGLTWAGRIVESMPPRRYVVEYYGGSIASFDLLPDAAGGVDLVLMDRGVPAEYRVEVIAGWVSVLMALKAAVEFGVDLRNHDDSRTWEQGYADN